MLLCKALPWPVRFRGGETKPCARKEPLGFQPKPTAEYWEYWEYCEHCERWEHCEHWECCKYCENCEP
jgi:hypothetical protein